MPAKTSERRGGEGGEAGVEDPRREAVTPPAYGEGMDILFTIGVWLTLAGLVRLGLRMTTAAPPD